MFRLWRRSRPKTTQITLEIGENVQRKLTSLSQLNETYSTVDVFRRALAVYEFLMTKHAREGATVILRYPDGTETEVELK